MPQPKSLDELQVIAKQVRRDIIEMITAAGSGHPGGSLSSVEILVTLYFGGGMKHDPANPKELGYFIPKPADDVKAPLSNDVYQDDRGLLIVTDKWRGMDVIEFTG